MVRTPAECGLDHGSAHIHFGPRRPLRHLRQHHVIDGMGPDGDQRIGLLAVEIALDRPLGIGPMQFYKLFVEDPHSTFLNAFMSGGWLAGFGYLSLCAVTLAMSTRFL